MTKITRALISVSDKINLDTFARGLASLGVEILSTGGTASFLAAAGIPVTNVADVTGFPEMMDGRVKTLHPNIHGALLAVRSNPEHMQTLATHAILPIDMVVVNLYPFAATIAKPHVSRAEAIENIDIGGPAMIRSAAKNHESVAVVTDTADYEHLLTEMRSNNGALLSVTLQSLAVKAYRLTSEYDAQITEYLRTHS